MANFDRSGMTQAGINLMGKAIGGATIKFTRLVMGDGTLTGSLDLEIEKLKNERDESFNKLYTSGKHFVDTLNDVKEMKKIVASLDKCSIRNVIRADQEPTVDTLKMELCSCLSFMTTVEDFRQIIPHNYIDEKAIADIEAIDIKIEELSKQQKAAVSSEILDLTGVISPKQNVDITSIERNDNQCSVGGALSTSSVKQGFFWRECGLYAMDPDAGEILYNYAYSTKPDYIAASDSGMMEEVLVSMIALVGANANVDVTIDDSMVFATKKVVDKKPYYYACVSDMKSDTNLKQGDMAITMGYYSPNDGGGASYQISNNEESYFEDISNSLKANIVIEKGSINIKQLGAKCDGFADDTEFLLKYKGDVDLVFPFKSIVKATTSGNPLININKSGVTVYGNDITFSLQDGTGIFLNVSSDCSSVLLKDFSIDYNNTCLRGTDNCVGIKFNYGVLNSSIENVHIFNYRNSDPCYFYGIEIRNNKKTLNNHVRRCTVKNIYTGVNNEIGDGIGSLRGIVVTKTIDVGVGDIIGSGSIVDCNFENLYNITSDGTPVLEDADAIQFFGYNSTMDVTCDAEYNYLIKNCTFKNAGKRCIKLQCSGVNIDGMKVDYDDSYPSNCIILIFGKNTTINNVKGKLRGYVIGGATANLHVSNVDVDCMDDVYGFSFTLLKDSTFNDIRMKNVYNVIKLEPIKKDSMLFGKYENVVFNRVDFYYRTCIINYDSKIEKTDYGSTNFIFNNSTFTVIKTQEPVALSMKNYNIEMFNCTFFLNNDNYANSGWFAFYNVIPATWENITFVYDDSITPRGKMFTIDVPTELTIKNTKIRCTKSPTDTAVNIYNAKKMTIDNIDLSKYSSSYAIYASLVKESDITLMNIILSETSTMRLGCTTATSKITLRNIRRINNVVNQITNMPTSEKIGTLILDNVKGKMGGQLGSSYTNIEYESMNNILGDSDGNMYMFQIKDGNISLLKI